MGLERDQRASRQGVFRVQQVQPREVLEVVGLSLP